MRKIDKIIVHCSATPEGRDVSVDTIKKWHVDDNKWSDIGYHYVIELDGGVHYGRNCEKSGAHCKGNNSDSIGICYVGGLDGNREPKDTRTDKQVKAMHYLIHDLRKKYPGSVVYGHRDFSSKACPSFDAKSEYSDV